MTNFWQKLRQNNPDGVLALAPMVDVTDNPFRRILSEIGPPDVYWTEFVAADGLAHPTGRPKLERLLSYEEKQRPIVAQIFSGNAQNCRVAAEICRNKGFDAIDINTGCPQRNILKQMCGSELIRRENWDIAKSVIEGTREGAGDVPVSVKTRIGFNQIDMGWIEFLLEQRLPLLTVHLRTKKEMSKVPAHWELMSEIRELRDRISPDTVLFGNGDVQSAQQAYGLVQEHGIDGVMIGRGLFNDPYFFNVKARPLKALPLQRIELALRHSQYFLDEYTVDGELTRGFHLMKKYYKIYINGFDGAKDLRTDMMNAKDLEEVQHITQNFLSKNQS